MPFAATLVVVVVLLNVDIVVEVVPHPQNCGGTLLTA